MLIQTRHHFRYKSCTCIYSVVIPIHMNREMAFVYLSFSYSSLTTNLKYTVPYSKYPHIPFVVRSKEGGPTYREMVSLTRISTEAGSL